MPRRALCLLAVLAAVACPAEVVLQPLRTAAERGPNRLANPGFEQLKADQPADWAPELSKAYQVDRQVAHSGQASLRCDKPDPATGFWLHQTVTLNQTRPTPLVISGWSRADQASGTRSSDYALYVDLQYVDGTPLYGQVALFDPGTHDWQFSELVFNVAKPVRSASVSLLFRGARTGTVWFDDVALQELKADGSGTFDGGQYLTPAPFAAPPAPALSVASGDGVRLGFTADGRLTEVSAGGKSLGGTMPGGFWVRDVAAKGPWVRLTGVARQDGPVLTFDGRDADAALRVTARLEPRADRIDGNVAVEDLAGRDRAVTLAVVLPVGGGGWTWQDDIVRSVPTAPGAEYHNAQGWPAAGMSSGYPLASITRPGVGLALGAPMDSPRVARFVYNSAFGALFAAFDFGLAPEPVKYPRRADARFTLYQHAPEWGFRSAVQGYYDRFPQFFAQRLKRGGIWMAFADIAKVKDWQDFGFAYDELGGKHAEFDNQHDIACFTYIEPMTYWLSMAKRYPRTYDGALQALADNEQSGKPDLVKWAQVTRCSGVYARDGKFDLSIENQSWCDGAVFTLNPDPNLPETPACPLNKGHLGYTTAWADQNIRQATGPRVDGIYLDSMPNWGERPNWRREHWRTIDVPLSFDPETKQPVLLQIFSTWQFSKWVADDVHARGGVMHGNGGTLWPYFPALLDITGQETGSILSDEAMARARTLLRNKPYSPLMNTRFDALGPGVVEDYFHRSLLYDIFPSFFNGSYQKDGAWVNVHYFTEPRFYERDRALYQRFIPVLRALFDAGWEVVPYAHAEPATVRVERYGQRLFAVYNPGKEAATVRLRVEAGPLKLTGTPTAKALLAGSTLTAAVNGATVEVSLPLAAGRAEVVSLAP